jgi:hypothetical protein
LGGGVLDIRRADWTKGSAVGRLSALWRHQLDDAARLVDSGTNMVYTGPAAFRTRMKSKLVKRFALVKEAGIAPEQAIKTAHEGIRCRQHAVARSRCRENQGGRQ